MKSSGLLLGVLLASVCRLSAQVTVEVALDQDQFLPGEALPASVRITNRSGQTLRLGSDADWLMFSVESRDGYVILKTGEAPVVGEFTLESSKRAIKRVDLAPYFNLMKPGRYSITATVTLKQWNQQIASQPKSFDIIEGAKLWEQEIGVPKPAGTANQAPEVRKYTLQEANHLRKNLELYLRLTDSSGRIDKVIPIGPMLSFSRPDPQVDRSSNLHVLYQNGPHSFNYTIINPDGNVIVRQTYDYTTRPRMQGDSDGNVTMTGGNRHVTPDDLPPPKVAETNATKPTP
jgi:hypothetical protein